MAGRYLDIDALAIARAELSTNGDGRPTVTIRGLECTLPAELPFALIVAIAVDKAESFYTAALALLGQEQLDAVVLAGASIPDIQALIFGVVELYGSSPEVSSVPEDS